MVVIGALLFRRLNGGGVLEAVYVSRSRCFFCKVFKIVIEVF